MVATTTGREDNIAEESTLAILPVCCLFLLLYLFVVSVQCVGWGEGS